MRLKDKVTIITGAASGIGKETALLFAKEGAKVIACDVNKERLESLEKEAADSLHGIVPCKLDVTDRDDISACVEDIEKRFGGVDVLINNAGITADALLVKMTEDQWDRVINVNLKGVFNMTQSVAPGMVERGSGVVLITSSVVGRYGNMGQTNYAATKAGVIGMTYSWAKEFGKKGLRFNAVAPGFIQTPMTKDLPEKVIDRMIEKTPLRRMGSPGDVAKMFLFLASDEASYVTGQVIGVDGGLVV
ncbi:MAG: 3-oxoacyl-ACP reductase FabG [Candidatus Undinarchaeales archaeon]|nr:3-oxoacyl-ACP reductase FabG [Candidatus Undinarchaeales archaeon]MDP7491475.1 3-oxoacyl-ACP reductase FabG [Candidatus Undinarchaeales archaeon]HIJ93688.1 3-oxoacyl-ACP reductase FabG [Rhodospirillaceae bacterium]